MFPHDTAFILFSYILVPLWDALNQEKSKSSSSLDSFKNFDASAELAQLEDRLKMKLNQPSKALSCADVACTTTRK